MYVVHGDCWGAIYIFSGLSFLLGASSFIVKHCPYYRNSGRRARGNLDRAKGPKWICSAGVHGGHNRKPSDSFGCPCVFSDYSSCLGLGDSYVSRLTCRAVYQRLDQSDPEPAAKCGVLHFVHDLGLLGVPAFDAILMAFFPSYGPP